MYTIHVLAKWAYDKRIKYLKCCAFVFVFLHCENNGQHKNTLLDSMKLKFRKVVRFRLIARPKGGRKSSGLLVWAKWWVLSSLWICFDECKRNRDQKVVESIDLKQKGDNETHKRMSDKECLSVWICNSCCWNLQHFCMSHADKKDSNAHMTMKEQKNNKQKKEILKWAIKKVEKRTTTQPMTAQTQSTRQWNHKRSHCRIRKTKSHPQITFDLFSSGNFGWKER